jgi:hypothetical protein
MHALHSTLLPSSSIHHSLYLPNFTPSSIYPLPAPHASYSPDIRVTGNLIVAGGSDLRVFEIREEKSPVLPLNDANGLLENGQKGEISELGAVEEDFYDNGPSDVNDLEMHIISWLMRSCTTESTITIRNEQEAPPVNETSITWHSHRSVCYTDGREQYRWIG